MLSNNNEHSRLKCGTKRTAFNKTCRILKKQYNEGKIKVNDAKFRHKENRFFCQGIKEKKRDTKIIVDMKTREVRFSSDRELIVVL